MPILPISAFALKGGGGWLATLTELIPWADRLCLFFPPAFIWVDRDLH